MQDPKVVCPFDRNTNRLTKAQRRAIEFAILDRALEIGGADGRKVRIDVAERLVWLGYLKYEYTATDVGFGIRTVFSPTSKAVNYYKGD